MNDQLSLAKEVFDQIADHCYNSGIETLSNTARTFTFEIEDTNNLDKVVYYIEELKLIACDMDITEYNDIELAYEELLGEIN
jgi:hypothetical protein